MAVLKYKDPITGDWIELSNAVGDTLPIGAIVEYDGTTVPTNWEKVNDYSTEEVRTGKTWIDGKPLYRKTIVLPNGTGTTAEKTYNMSEFGLENIEMMSLESPSYYTLIGAGNIKTTFNFNYNDGNKFSVGFGITKKVIHVNLGYSYICNNECVITVIYTKTTD